MRKTITLDTRSRRSLIPDIDDEELMSMPRPSRIIKVTWQEAVDDYIRQLKGTLEEKTILFYRCRLRVLGRWLEQENISLLEFKARHMRLFLAHRADEGVSDSTRRHDVIGARIFFKFCYRENYIPENPLADYKPAKVVKPYVKCPSDEEVIALLKGVIDRWKPALNPKTRFVAPAYRTFFSRRNYAIFAGLIETACRASEMLALTLDDYRPAEGQIIIQQSKGKEPRYIPISETWMAAMDAYLRVRPRVQSNLIFMNEYGEPIPVAQISKVFRGYVRYAGLSGFTLHGLRHYALTKLAETDVWAASLIAGHKDIKVTRGYLHQNMQHLKQVHAQAAPLARLLVNVRSERERKKRVI